MTQRFPAFANVAILEQGIDLLERIDDRLYHASADFLPGGTVAAHFRHCLEFYHCFLEGRPAGKVDYELRRRDPEPEMARHLAAAGLRRLLPPLRALEPVELEEAILVRGDRLDEEEARWVRSTIGRELQALLSHTIHHHALIGAVLRSHGHAPPPEFGVAPSTLRHWAQAT